MVGSILSKFTLTIVHAYATQVCIGFAKKVFEVTYALGGEVLKLVKIKSPRKKIIFLVLRSMFCLVLIDKGTMKRKREQRTFVMNGGEF